MMLCVPLSSPFRAWSEERRDASEDPAPNQKAKKKKKKKEKTPRFGNRNRKEAEEKGANIHFKPLWNILLITNF